MEPSLGHVLRLPRLGLRQVGGNSDLARPLRWVATSELADPSPYLEGREILLTTGMNLPPNGDEQLSAYVGRLAEREVAALGLAIGLTHPTVPAGLVAAADAHDLTLFEVPLSTPFIAVTRAVADLLGRADKEALQRSLDLQRGLTRAAARPDGARSVLHELARQTGAWVALTGPAGVPVHTTGQLPHGAAAELAAEVRRLRPRGLHAASSLAVGSQVVELQPVGTSGRPTAYLVVGTDVSSSRPERSAVATAVSLLSLIQERTGLSSALQERMAGEVLQLLLAGDVTTARHLAAVVSRRPLPEQVVVLAVDGGDTVPHADTLLTEHDGGLVGLTGTAAAEQVAADIAATGATLGLSRPTSLDGVAAALGEARQALASAASAAGATGEAVGRYDDLVREGIGALVDPDHARRWADATLAPLREQGAGKVDLVHSLRTYLNHHGQWHPAAAELGIHRHTLRHRMRRVEQVLGGSLDSPQTRMNLWFALQHSR